MTSPASPGPRRIGALKVVEVRQARDPVCGMMVSEDSPLRAAHQGKTYYFCNPSCRTAFLADPPRYLSPSPTPSSSSSPSSSEWTCPMHPEIVRDHPGACPIC